MRFITTIFLNIFLGQFVLAQGVSLQFQPLFEGEALVLEKKYEQQDKPLTVEILKYYISKVELLKKGEVVWSEDESYHLVNIEEPTSLQIPLATPKHLKYDAIRFALGIDSLTNVSGVFGGDLDPTKGMYWTWASGYINFKLEGSFPDCPTRGNAYQFHLGGYAAPFASMQQVARKVKCGKDIAIAIDVFYLLNELNLSKQHTVMSPSAEAQQLSQIVAQAFKVLQR